MSAKIRRLFVPAVLALLTYVGLERPAGATIVRVSVEGIVKYVERSTYPPAPIPDGIVVGETRMKTAYFVDTSKTTTDGPNDFIAALLSMRVQVGHNNYKLSPKYCNHPDSSGCSSRIVLSADGQISSFGNAYLAEYFLGYGDIDRPHYAGVAFSTEEDLRDASPFANGNLIPIPDYPYTGALQYIDIGGGGDDPEFWGSINRIKVTVREPSVLILLISGLLILTSRCRWASRP